MAVVAEDDGESKVNHRDESAALAQGSLVYCRLHIRRVVKETEAMVVEAGAWQTVVACPADCSLSLSGDWAGCASLGSWQSLQCAGVEQGTSCAVVFYVVDTRSLSTNVLPEALRFRGCEGQPLTPCAQSLSELFESKAGRDALLMQALLTDEEQSPRSYHEVRIGGDHELFSWNSVLTIPDFLSKDECHVFMDAADRCARSGSTAKNLYAYQGQMHRLPVRKLDLEAQMLSSSVVSDRLLGFIEQHMPEVALDLFGQSERLREMKFCFSPGEPAVNRYMVGGGIAPHTDKQSVTLNVLLSEPGAFSGGGTVFWPQDSPEEANGQGAVVVRPRQGTAVLFNGDVKHAGRPVTDGIRHTFVASFNLWSLEG
mmetsp:Transcript_104052/g.303774  ORF Transcript_104052/g.303774 Transcript_104052/m.303774 type:complete len:370 (-) Transcript_104052:94-1203(-)